MKKEILSLKNKCYNGDTVIFLWYAVLAEKRVNNEHVSDQGSKGKTDY